MLSKKCFLVSDGDASAQGDDAGIVNGSVGVTQQNVRETSLQGVLAQEGGLLHHLERDEGAPYILEEDSYGRPLH